ncbi:hypothetical protein Rleg2_4158 [Rhizobium leguminosarum bv. trifolii WSM2304]|uniref:Uncharacterized protein n=1 Tax=Rhizobium leguminosarum bv. trifolii (strain WSM2304) TaxID=395492 RepID=A0ABF7QTP5_RHILW|nr:hypothetical protein [Rhizobium leguminosarum]ACI57420.1 hypothetical protein Rleg2_4158 [Rhizobium leguminosarum bv. trifolii WSM2304]
MSLFGHCTHLIEAHFRFSRIAAGGDPLENAVCGLSAVLQATTAADPKIGFPVEVAEDLGDRMLQVTPMISEAAGKWIARELTNMGMAAAIALVTRSADDPLRHDQRCYAALLHCDLSAAVCRREIARRGDPLVRVIGIERAWSASDHNEHPLQ